MYKKLISLSLIIIIISITSIPGLAYTINKSDYNNANDDFTKYVESLFNINNKNNLYSSGRQQLNNINEYIIDQLELEIDKIARGDISNTIISITYDNPYEFNNITINDIKNAILVDKEYELYWFDKTSKAFDITTYNNIIVIKMPVSMNYSIDNIKNSYKVDTSHISRAITAVENANNILKNVPKNLSDYGVLSYFKDKILELSDYVDVTDDLKYGDVFQMIYVFDNDPNTKVVCEGYSKAFKYLCDSYNFTGNIKCNLVTGVIISGNFRESHMWNIVSIDNKNYLVDITNSALDCLGENNELFLRGITSKNAYYTNTGDFYGCNINIDSTTVQYIYDKSTMSTYKTTERIIDRNGDPQLYNIIWLDAFNNIILEKQNCFSYEIPIEEYTAPKWNLEINDNIYTFKQLETTDIVDYIKGDLDADGRVTSADALTALRISVNLTPITDYYLFVGDMDNDNLITSSDALTILRISVGLCK